MRNKAKKLLSLVAAATLLGSTLALSACDDYYKGDKLEDYVESQTAATSNGGFAVEKDGYVYFINGMEDYSVANEYGEVVKGALMRIKASDLEAGNYGEVKTVVPMLFVAQNFDAGIYIYGDYVYYATPTTDKNMQGVVENTWIDFKRAKLDGTEAMKGYFFRLSDNTSKYRFVEVDGTVYCLYEQDSALKSYNTATGVTTVLAEGAGTFYYDMKDLTNPNVYYTMAVTYNIDSDVSSTASYNQIYCVNAAATATVNAKEASYTVKKADGTEYRTYDFDKEYLEEQNAEAKKTAEKNNTDYEATYVFDDYTTYPYVNLGTLVLDGVGSECEATQYNDEVSTAPAELQGYTYTIARYENGGVYYTRTEVTANNKLYYLSENATADTVAANKAETGASSIVALNTTNASSTALFEVNDGVHTYLYVSGSSIYRATADATGKATEVKLCGGASSVTLWKTEGEDLYYYGSGSNPVTGASTSGNTLHRINYKGDADKYDTILNLDAEAKYKPVTLTYVDFSSAWYKPEIFGTTLLYANAQSIGSVSYNYIYAMKLLDSEKIEENNDKYEAVYKHIEEDFENADLKNALTYYYRTGSNAAFEAVKSLYTDEQIKLFNEFAAAAEAGTYITEGDLIALVGEIKEGDAEAIAEAWADTLLSEAEEEEEESGLEWWAILLIVVGSVLVVGGVTATVVIYLTKKKAAEKEAEATVNAYKRPKIDTTDDKSIDVYADEETEAPSDEKQE